MNRPFALTAIDTLESPFSEVFGTSGGAIQALESQTGIGAVAHESFSPFGSEALAPDVTGLAGGPTLRRGSSGAAVAALQLALTRLGYAAVSDGRFGPGTQRAVVGFQSRNGLNADGVVGPQTRAAIALALAGSGGVPVPPPPIPPPPVLPPSTTHRLVVDELPMLSRHVGTRPDMILRWNNIVSSGEVDVVVHFHGYSGLKKAMRIDVSKEPTSGLDFADPGGSGAAGRSVPTVAILPRGNFFGGTTKTGYNFPALTSPGALQALIVDALVRVSRETGLSLTMRRLILTGHSGGGAPVSAILAHTDPDEVHIFDGTYGGGTNIIRWAEKRIKQALANPSGASPALRILYRPGTQTAGNAETIGRALCKPLANPDAARLRPHFRAEATRVAHNDIPARFGWRLLANAAADVPDTTLFVCPAPKTVKAQSDKEDRFEQESVMMNERHDLAFDEAYGPFAGEGRDGFAYPQSESLAWLEPEAFDTEQFEPEGFADEADEAEWFGSQAPESEEFEPEAFDALILESAESGWGEDEQVFETPYGNSGETQMSNLSTLESLLESEAGSVGLSDRLKGTAAFVLGPTLRRGSSGPAVETLQRALQQLGHNPGVADSQFGPATERAVRAFQSVAGLTPDGVVGPRTKAAIAAALGGKPGPTPQPAPPLPVPGTIDIGVRIASIAELEFSRWHSPAKLRETDTAAVPILQQYYRDGVKMAVSAAELQDTSWQQAHPWSAVFISFVMRSAAVGALFKYAAAHQQYVAAARKNRLDGNTANPFWAYRATEVAPQVGDLVCASRSNSGATYDNIGDGKTRATHCDVVTEVRNGSLRVVGGNVNQNVDAKIIKTLPDGRLDLSGKQARFFAVLRCRGAVGGPPPGPQPAPPGSVPPPLKSGPKLSPAQFAATYGAFAKASQAKTGVPMLVALGQAALESGWGEKAPRFNLFGIKARETDPEPTRQLLRTREVFSTPDKKFARLVSVKPRPDGRYDYIIDDWFRAYSDAETAFNAHGEFLFRNKRYQNAFTFAGDPYAFASEVARAGYATDPNYAQVLHSVMRMIERSGAL